MKPSAVLVLVIPIVLLLLLCSTVGRGWFGAFLPRGSIDVYLIVYFGLLLASAALLRRALLRRSVAMATVVGAVTGQLLGIVALLTQQVATFGGAERIVNSLAELGVLAVATTQLLGAFVFGAWLFGAIVFLAVRVLDARAAGPPAPEVAEPSAR